MYPIEQRKYKYYFLLLIGTTFPPLITLPIVLLEPLSHYDTVPHPLVVWPRLAFTAHTLMAKQDIHANTLDSSHEDNTTPLIVLHTSSDPQ